MLNGTGLISIGISYIPPVLIFFFLVIQYAIIANSAVITMREALVVMDRIITAIGTFEDVSDLRH